MTPSPDTPSDPVLHLVTGTFALCSACLDGAGGECHTPGCLLWINRGPDLPIRGVLNDFGCHIRAVTKYVVPCTGAAAVWCPNHGDCACDAAENGERALDAPHCPLHSAESEHAEDAA